MNAPPPTAALQSAVTAPTEEFLWQFVNAIQNPVFVKDEQLRFVFFNDAFCTLLGQPRESLMGRTDYDVVPVEQAAFFQEIDGKVLASGTPLESEEMLTGADGSEYWLVTRKSIFEVPGAAGSSSASSPTSPRASGSRRTSSRPRSWLKTPTAPSRNSWRI